MSSLQFVNYLWCPDNAHYYEKVKDYHVNYDMRNGWTCTCKGFQFRKNCKHIEEVENNRCGWGGGALIGSPSEEPEDGKCPECGKKLEVVIVGV